MNYRILLAVVVAVSLSVFSSVQAAEPNVLLFSVSSEVAVGDTVAVHVSVRHSEAINALSASIAYDRTMLEYLGSSDAGSVVRMWVQRPLDTDGVISFEGVIPGGLQPILTDRAPITTLRFRALREGRTLLRGDAPQLFAHQPQTRLLDTIPTTQSIIVAGFGTQSPSPEVSLESYDLRVVRFVDEGWFLVYDIRTSDGSVSSVRIRERFLGLPVGEWRDAISPERLSDQWRLSILDVEVSGVSPYRRFSIISWPLWVAWAILLVLLGWIVSYYLRRRNY